MTSTRRHIVKNSTHIDLRADGREERSEGADGGRTSHQTSLRWRADVSPLAVRQRADVAPTAGRRRSDVAPMAVRRRAVVVPTSGRRRAAVRPTSRRCRADVALTSGRCAAFPFSATVVLVTGGVLRGGKGVSLLYLRPPARVVNTENYENSRGFSECQRFYRTLVAA